MEENYELSHFMLTGDLLALGHCLGGVHRKADHRSSPGDDLLWSHLQIPRLQLSLVRSELLIWMALFIIAL